MIYVRQAKQIFEVSTLSVIILSLYSVVFLSLIGLSHFGQFVYMVNFFVMMFSTMSWIVISSLIKWQKWYKLAIQKDF